MGVPNYQLTTNFSANCQLTTIFLANCQLTVNPISTLKTVSPARFAVFLGKKDMLPCWPLSLFTWARDRA